MKHVEIVSCDLLRGDQLKELEDKVMAARNNPAIEVEYIQYLQSSCATETHSYHRLTCIISYSDKKVTT